MKHSIYCGPQNFKLHKWQLKVRDPMEQLKGLMQSTKDVLYNEKEKSGDE
jgi:hypothetical protein